MYSAYLDRFTDDNHALILVEQLQQEFHVPASSLPSGSTAGTWFLVEIKEDRIASLHIDDSKTRDMKKAIDNRMQRLKSNQRSRFKRN